MSGGRIEIPMEEYNGMRERVRELETTVVSKDKEIEALKDKLLGIQNDIDDIAELTLFERMFGWNKNVERIIKDD